MEEPNRSRHFDKSDTKQNQDSKNDDTNDYYDNIDKDDDGKEDNNN